MQRDGRRWWRPVQEKEKKIKKLSDFSAPTKLSEMSNLKYLHVIRPLLLTTKRTLKTSKEGVKTNTFLWVFFKDNSQRVQREPVCGKSHQI